MEGYKLTNTLDQTWGGTQWGEGVEHTATGPGVGFCTPDLIHFYDHPLLAVLHNPIHVNYQPALLWRGEAMDPVYSDMGIKWGCKRFRTLERTPLPKITPTQITAYGILCALEVYQEPSWRAWAKAWLDGTDRTIDSAYAARATATAYLAAHASAAEAAAAAIYAAAATASASVAPTDAAYAAAAAASAATHSDRVNKPFSLLACAQAALDIN